MEQLCNLVHRRLALIEEVSKAKWNTQSPIEDAEREQTILVDVAAKARSLGLSPAWTQHFFRMQIEASKAIEYQLFAEWKETKQGHFTNTLDLKKEARPQLNELTDALLNSVTTVWPTLSSPGGATQVWACHSSSKFGLASTIALTPLVDRSAETADTLNSTGQKTP